MWFDSRGPNYDCWYYEHGGADTDGCAVDGRENFDRTAKLPFALSELLELPPHADAALLASEGLLPAAEEEDPGAPTGPVLPELAAASSEVPGLHLDLGQRPESTLLIAAEETPFRTLFFPPLVPH